MGFEFRSFKYQSLCQGGYGAVLSGMVQTCFISRTDLGLRRELPGAWAVHMLVFVGIRGKRPRWKGRGRRQSEGLSLLLCQARKAGKDLPWCLGLSKAQGLSCRGPRRPSMIPPCPGEHPGGDCTPGWQGPWRRGQVGGSVKCSSENPGCFARGLGSFQVPSGGHI